MKFSEMPYTRVDLDEYKKQIQELTEKLKAAKSAEEQFEIHKKQYEVYDHASTNQILAHIRHDIDTTDEFYSKEQDYNDEIEPQIKEFLNEYSKTLFESPYKEGLIKIMGPVSFKNMELQLRSFKPEMIPLMQEENALITEYSKLIANIKIKWEGETYNLSLMKKFMNDKDREVRKKAYKAATDALLELRPQIDEIYDKMVKNRTAQAKMLGYETYTRLGYDRMQRNDYGPDEIKRFREEVKKKIVPLACKVNELRRQRLGLDHLYYYDSTNFIEGDPTPIGTPEEILKNGQKMYAELSSETKEFFDFMMENEMFDVLGRKTKRAGGYMTYLPDYKSPFIFANFNQTTGDVDVITHECGHAFQGYLMKDAEVHEHADITMETAEIHSMSMEFFTEPWMEKFFGDRAKDYVQMHLEEAITFIPYGCMVDEFQNIIYENPDMTAEERRNVWLDLEKQYRPDYDFSGNELYESGAYWQRQGHIFQVPFYYIDYCLAQTVALEYKAWMDKDYKAAWESYLKLCKMAASDFYSNMIPAVGLKLPFEEGCLDETVEIIGRKMGV